MPPGGRGGQSPALPTAPRLWPRPLVPLGVFWGGGLCVVPPKPLPGFGWAAPGLRGLPTSFLLAGYHPTAPSWCPGVAGFCCSSAQLPGFLGGWASAAPRRNWGHPYASPLRWPLVTSSSRLKPRAGSCHPRTPVTIRCGSGFCVPPPFPGWEMGVPVSPHPGQPLCQVWGALCPCRMFLGCWGELIPFSLISHPKPTPLCPHPGCAGSTHGC